MSESANIASLNSRAHWMPFSANRNFQRDPRFIVAAECRWLTDNHVFFTGSGFESADTAVKMARAYWRAKGLPAKTKLIGRARGYHGVNIAGTNLGGIGGIGGNRKMFGQFMDVDHLPHTHRPISLLREDRPKPAPKRWRMRCSG